MPAKLPEGEARRRRNARSAAYYQAHKAEKKARNKAGYRDDWEKNRAAKRAGYHKARTTPEGWAALLWSGARGRAKAKGLVFSITREFVEKALRKGACEVTGFKFTMESGKGRGPFSPSMDRKDNLKGYTEENIRFVVWAFNSACGNWGEEVLWQIVKAAWPDRVK